MHEHVPVAHAHERELAEVRVRGKVFERVQERAEQAERLILVLLAPVAARLPADVDALLQEAPDERFRGIPVAGFVRDIVLMII